MSHFLGFSLLYLDGVMKEVKMGMERMEVRFLEREERMEIACPLN